MPKGLTARQKAFADLFLSGMSAAASARAAGYSESSVRCVGAILRSPAVAAYLALRRGEVEGLDGPGKVLAALAAVGFADIDDFAEVRDGQVVLKDTGALPPERRAAIVSIKQGAKGPEIRLADRLRALEMLGRALGLFSPGGKEAEGAVELVDDEE